MRTSDWVILISAIVPFFVFIVWWLVTQMAETFDDPRDFEASKKMHAEWAERESKWGGLK
jgi:hypothetical protein